MAPKGDSNNPETTKKSRKRNSAPPAWTGWMQWLLVELCIVTVFGMVAFSVFQSIEKKRQAYRITELISRKVELEDSVNFERNRIEGLSSLERINGLVREHQLKLAPADRPALVLDLPVEDMP